MQDAAGSACIQGASGEPVLCVPLCVAGGAQGVHASRCPCSPTCPTQLCECMIAIRVVRLYELLTYFMAYLGAAMYQGACFHAGWPVVDQVRVLHRLCIRGCRDSSTVAGAGESALFTMVYGASSSCIWFSTTTVRLASCDLAGPQLCRLECFVKQVNSPHVTASCPMPFDEGRLWKGSDALQLKAELQAAFQNITRVMDCVGCEKCKLWGKLQTLGKVKVADSWAKL